MINETFRDMVLQAGSLVYKIELSELKFLMVRSKKNPSQWVFPKGHMEEGEEPAQTAERELAEEAGVQGALIGHLGNRQFVMKEKLYNVEYFLFRYEKNIGMGEAGREPSWYTKKEVEERLAFPGMEQILGKGIAVIKQTP